MRVLRLSDVSLSVAYIGPKSRTERPRKTKIGAQVAHVTGTPLSMSKGQRSRSPGRFGWLFKSPHNLSRRQQFICHRPVTTCTGRGHSMAAPLQAAQLGGTGNQTQHNQEKMWNQKSKRNKLGQLVRVSLDRPLEVSLSADNVTRTNGPWVSVQRHRAE